MTVGNIATDGYGLNATEKPNVPVNGYGVGLPTGLFDGSVKGTGMSAELVEAFFDELLLIDAELEHAVTLTDTVTVTELVGIPVAMAQMVGVDGTARVLGSVVAVEVLDPVLATDAALLSTASHIESLGSGEATSTALDSAPVATPGMIGTDDTETGVV
jgi:hypothetical protein